ncbi:hypothetical protein [Micromonospora siamensis]|uniref:Uncharacterized protein n=1 Tax=Micromonospora siamensis TaxID=299152 RepID=A0A1C5H1G5_9ACTN|nr:hypothetical protein [Micromonospora siamensis]SCG39896.1 hypothetical protein GA0074704_0891 [Micromonospora siamensis]
MQNQPGGEPPVFVDRTGRRRRLTMVAGTVMGLGLLTSVGLIAAGLFSDSSVSLPGWSEQGRRQAPIEAGVRQESLDEAGQPASRQRPRPTTATSTAAPLPTRTATTGATPATTTTTATATSGPTATTTATPTTQPTPSTSPPGQGDVRRSTAKPSRSPGKP